jgi:SpoVK/Ycf46/Vps4 family AAA+-type ATPase
VIEEKGGASDGQAQRLITTTLTTFGRSRKIFETLLAEVMASQKSSDDVDVYVWNAGRYKSVEDKPSRPMDSVFLDPDLKKDILSDATRFSTGAQWYRERSLPHRRGYLLDGPPGTGKSSTIHALASELRCPLYIINPNNLSDDSIAEAFQLAGRGIIVLEDVDRIKVAISEERVESPPLNSGLSLSGFLNAIDGVAASEGRILIMTSNRPDILDPAFIRPGRIDRQFHIGYLSPSTAFAMTCRFLGDVAGRSFYSTRVECLLAQGLAASRLQNMLLEEIAKTEGWT